MNPEMVIRLTSAGWELDGSLKDGIYKRGMFSIQEDGHGIMVFQYSDVIWNDEEPPDWVFEGLMHITVGIYDNIRHCPVKAKWHGDRTIGVVTPMGTEFTFWSGDCHEVDGPHVLVYQRTPPGSKLMIDAMGLESFEPGVIHTKDRDVCQRWLKRSDTPVECKDMHIHVNPHISPGVVAVVMGGEVVRVMVMEKI